MRTIVDMLREHPDFRMDHWEDYCNKTDALVTGAADKIEELTAVLEEVMEWISNWGVPFMEDPEWGKTYDKVIEALEDMK